MTPGPPQQYVLRKPSGSPEAARALAQAYDALAESVAAQARIAAQVLAGLPWHGQASRAAAQPERALAEMAARLVRALQQSAADLRTYAHRLERAHENHGWSIGRLAALGAVVVVGAAAVVVTVGAAAPAEAAAATAAVEGAEAAATAAEAAGSTAATDMTASRQLLDVVKPFAPFVVPHVMSAGLSVGYDVVSDLLTVHRLDPRSLEVAAAVGFTGSAVTGAVEARLAHLADVTRRLMEGGTWAAGSTVGDLAVDGQVDPADTVASGLKGLVARDVRRVLERAVKNAPRSHPPAGRP